MKNQKADRYSDCLASLALSSPSVLKRRRAILLLEKHDANRAVTSALRAVEDPSWIVRRTAIDILSRHSPENSLPVFAKLVLDQDPAVQTGAAEAIRNAGKKGSEAAMIRLLKDETASVSARSAALSYIGKHVADARILRECAILVLRDVELSYILPERIDVPTEMLIEILSLPERDGMSELLDFSLPLFTVRKSREAVSVLRALLCSQLGDTDYRDAYEKNEIFSALDKIGWEPTDEENIIRSQTATLLKDDGIDMLKGFKFPG